MEKTQLRNRLIKLIIALVVVLWLRDCLKEPTPTVVPAPTETEKKKSAPSYPPPGGNIDANKKYKHVPIYEEDPYDLGYAAGNERGLIDGREGLTFDPLGGCTSNDADYMHGYSLGYETGYDFGDFERNFSDCPYYKEKKEEPKHLFIFD